MTTGAAIGAAAILASLVAWSLGVWPATASSAVQESSVVAITPARILDTRDGVGVGLTGRFFSPSPRELRVTGAIETTDGTRTVVPPGATGVLLNVTVVAPTADGFISVRPAGTAGPPATSSLNFLAGDVSPNSVQVSVPTSGPDVGRIEITYDAYGMSGAAADVLVDVVAYTTTAGLDSLAASIAAKPDPPIIQQLEYTNLVVRESVGTSPVKVRDIGTFTKAAAGTSLRLTWQSHVTGLDGQSGHDSEWCIFQVRIDDRNVVGGTGRTSTDFIYRVAGMDFDDAPVNNMTIWDGIGAGQHTVSVWVSAIGAPDCIDNNGSFDRSVIIEEFTAS